MIFVGAYFFQEAYRKQTTSFQNALHDDRITLISDILFATCEGGGLRRVMPEVIARQSPFSEFSAECEYASVYVFPNLWTHTPLPRDVALEPSIA